MQEMCIRDSLWTHPELFQTDREMHLTQVAGCPPDAFAADGQLWGNPLYDWPPPKATGFAWWKRRMQHATSIYDVVRIDHFRGFESYYSIPAGNKLSLIHISFASRTSSTACPTTISSPRITP